MIIDYLNETLSEEQLFKLTYEKGKSKDSVGVLHSALANFEYFTLDQFDKPRIKVLRDLMIEYKKNRDTRAPLVLLNNFKNWISDDHPDIMITVGNGGKRPLKAKSGKTKKGYLNQVKKWMKLCGGIKIDHDDYHYFVSIPNSELEEDDEADPVTAKELQKIILATRDGRRRAKWYFMKCTAARHLETLRIKKKHIDFGQKPPLVRLPKYIVKGKTRTRFAYLDSETDHLVAEICNRINDDDFVFRPNDSNEIHFRNNEITWWNKTLTKLGLGKKGRNGHLIKRIHSIRSFAMKAVEKGTNDPIMGDAYGGHKKFVGKYLDKTEEERRELFKRSEKYMMIFKEIEVVDNQELLDELKKENETLKKDTISRNEFALLQNQLDDVKQAIYQTKLIQSQSRK